jgi:hypothetical protein
MIVDKVWKLTNTVRVGLDARSRCVTPSVTLCKFDSFFVFLEFLEDTHKRTHTHHSPTNTKTNTLEVLLNLSHHIPDPNLPTIKLVDNRSLLIRSC